MGILEQLLGYGKPQQGGLSPQDRSQAFFAGLGGLGQSLSAAGAPRVGSPGPGLAAGLGGFQPAYQDSRKQLLAAQMQRELLGLKKQALEAKGTGNEARAPVDVTLTTDIPGVGVAGASTKVFPTKDGRFLGRNNAGKLVELSSSSIKPYSKDGPVKPLTSGLFDQRGQLKPSATNSMKSILASSLGAQVDDTGRVMGLDPPIAKMFPKILARAENLVKSGKAQTLSDGVDMALNQVTLPQSKSLVDMADSVVGSIEASRDDKDNAVEKLKASDATGVGSGVRDFVLNQVMGQISPNLVDKNVVNARQELGLLANDFVVAEKRSPRLPVWEQIRLSKIFTEPSAWRSPEQVREQLKGFDERLTDSIEFNRTILEAKEFSARDKREAFSNIRQLALFRNRVRKFDLDTVSEGFSVGNALTAEPNPQSPSVTMPIPGQGDIDLINKYRR